MLGVLYIVAGFVAWDNPLLTAVWLTSFLGAALVASGIMRIFLAFNMQHGSPWMWVVGLRRDHPRCSASSSSSHWPVSALYTLGIFLGVDLVFAGASWIGLGMGLHRQPEGGRGRLTSRGSSRRSGEARRNAFRGEEIFPVRWLYLAIVVVFVAALIVFAFQNTGSVSVSFLSWAIDSPLVVVVVVVYVLGAVTGGSLYGLLRRSVAGVRR